MKRTLLLALALCVAAASVALAGQTRMINIHNAAPEDLGGSAVRTFITADGDEAEIEAFRQRLIHAGARNVNWFGDNVIVCDLPKSVDFAPVLSSPGVVARAEADVPDYTPGSDDFVSQVKYAYDVVERMRATPGVHAGSDFEERVNVISPERERRIHKSLMSHPALSPSGIAARGTNQNSEILTGSIKVYIIMPESNGQIDPNRENWYDQDGGESQDLVNARTHAFGALLDWQSGFGGMGITYRVIPLVPACNYEPILHTMVDDEVWILDAMRTLDPKLAGLDDPVAAVHAWNEENKGGYDWIFTMFIGHSRSVVGHRFGDGGADYTAYANLGGPYLVNPYPAGLDPNNIGEDLVYSKIIQHESAHIFWTLDEYPGAPGFCASSSGYLNYANMNVNYSTPGGISRCIPEIECIMDRAARRDVPRPGPWCRWSLGHLGVIDDNGNAIPDVFEAPPIIEFETQGPDTVNTGDYTIRLTTISQAVPNRNTAIPEEERFDYAAPLKEAQFSVGGGWNQLPAADGRWDGIVENTSVRLNGLPPGAMSIKFRVRNSVGMFSPVYTKTVYFLGIRFAHFSVSPRDRENRVTWEVVGENFGARFDVYRLDASEPIPDLSQLLPGEELPGIPVASDVRPAGAGDNGFVPYAVYDKDVTPGARYRYYVNAVGEVEFQGEPRTFYSPSKLVSQTAMVPVPSGRLVSYVSPNPFRDQVTLSIAVPKTFNQEASYQQRVATPVNVTVYDVLGRAVRTLHTSSSFEDVVTLKWNGIMNDGSAATSGVYFVRVKAGPVLAVEKVLLVR